MKNNYLSMGVMTLAGLVVVALELAPLHRSDGTALQPPVGMKGQQVSVVAEDAGEFPGLATQENSLPTLQNPMAADGKLSAEKSLQGQQIAPNLSLGAKAELAQQADDSMPKP